MKSLVLLSLVVIATVVSACGAKPNAAGSELASNYPPDYTWGEKCQSNDVVTVCRSSAGSYHVHLRIEYRGYLKDTAAQDVRPYIKLNGRDGMFAPLSSSNTTKLASGPYNCRGEYGPLGYERTICDDPSPAMANLFFYAKDQFGRVNAWDLELAFFDGHGNRWDSNNGANYKFRIEP